MNRSLAVLLAFFIVIALLTGRLVDILIFCTITALSYTFIKQFSKEKTIEPKAPSRNQTYNKKSR